MPAKTCTICRNKQPLQNFDKNPLTKDGRGSQCKRCSVAQRARRLQQSKIQLIELFGGQCAKCGYDSCPAALEFHHPDGTKEASISQLMYRTSFEKTVKEAKKCKLLCANCHREKHYEDRGPLLGKRRRTSGCGTLAGYKKCGPSKCELCRAVKRKYMKMYRRKSNGG